MALALTKTDPTPTPRRGESRASGKVLPFPGPSKKPCRTCKSEKAIDDFSRHNTSRDKHRHDCRQCVSTARGRNKPQRITARSKPKAVAQKAALPAAPYQRSPAEQAAVDKFRQQHRERPTPSMRITRNDDGGIEKIQADHVDPFTGGVVMMASLGTANQDIYKGLVSQLADLGPLTESDLNYSLALLQGVRPRDEVEGMLAAQMVAIHAPRWQPHGACRRSKPSRSRIRHQECLISARAHTRRRSRR
jgi:hypothetical protein